MKLRARGSPWSLRACSNRCSCSRNASPESCRVRRFPLEAFIVIIIKSVLDVLRFGRCKHTSSVRFSSHTYRDPALGCPVGTFVDSYDVLACRKCCLHYAVLNDASHHRLPRNSLRLPPLEIPVRKNTRKG